MSTFIFIQPDLMVKQGLLVCNDVRGMLIKTCIVALDLLDYLLLDLVQLWCLCQQFIRANSVLRLTLIVKLAHIS